MKPEHGLMSHNTDYFETLLHNYYIATNGEHEPWTLSKCPSGTKGAELTQQRSDFIRLNMSINSP
jgi:hypothetical protein